MIGTFELFGREISAYVVAAIVGLLIAGAFVYKMCDRHGLDNVSAVFLLLFSAVGVLIGGHLMYAVTNIDKLYLFGRIQNFDDFILVIQIIFGGQVFYGGLFGGIAAGCIYAKASHLKSFGGYADLCAAAVPLFHVFGRIGCFLGGCCYGIESDFGFTFYHSTVEQANGVCRFPVQLFEAGFNLLLFIFILILLEKSKFKNHLFMVYLPIYAAGRFVLEFFRGDEYRGFLFGLSTSQLISLGILAVIGVWAIVRLCRRNRKCKKAFSP